MTITTPDPVDVAYNIFLEQEKTTSVGYALKHDPGAADRVRGFIRRLIAGEVGLTITLPKAAEDRKFPPLKINEPKTVRIGNLADSASAPITQGVGEVSSKSETVTTEEKVDVEAK